MCVCCVGASAMCVCCVGASAMCVCCAKEEHQRCVCVVRKKRCLELASIFNLTVLLPKEKVRGVYTPTD
jgi:hypothetical protein